MKNAFYITGVLVFVMILGQLFISSTETEQNKYQQGFNREYGIYALDIPESMELAGEKVPLEFADVRERLDRELLVNTYWQSNALLFFKRSNRWFPVIEPILKENGIPDDFKYIALIESGLQDVKSPSGAVGYWQFLKETAKSYALEVSSEVDERYHVIKSTEAACKYFKDAYKEFNNWTLVAASYNMGMGGVKRQLEIQSVGSFYDLYLNRETSRYIFRILAAKEILTHPRKYGFHFMDYHLYEPYKCRIVEVDSTIDDLYEFAKTHQITYRQLKIHNPWLRRQKLTNTKRQLYRIEIPISSYNDEKTLLRANQTEPQPDIPKEEVSEHVKSVYLESQMHVVKKNESIHDVAAKYQVEVGEIIQWNDLKGEDLYKGQKLKIYKPIDKSE